MSRLGTTYKQVVRLLPAAYREQYGEPMIQMLEDMLDDQPSLVAKVRVWLRAMLDLPITATYQYAQLGGATMNQLPNYAKQGTAISAVLLIPFFILVAMNAIRPFTASWRQVGYIGIFILPVIALLIGVMTVAGLLASKKLSLNAKQLRQLSTGWAVLIVPILALLIVSFAYGHDSVHCVMDGSPSKIERCISNS
jgi:hypothetical protein